MTDPYARAAAVYQDRGWSPLPLPLGKKAPPPGGYTGWDGEWADPDQIDEWINNGSGGGNVGLRLPRDVIGIDVDAYDEKPGAESWDAAVAAHGEPPPTVRSTSRGADNPSGIRLYRLPFEAEPGMVPDTLPGIDMIHFGHRYMVASPSLHPEGGRYEWVSPESKVVAGPNVSDLPILPQGWVIHITGTCGCPRPKVEKTAGGTMIERSGLTPEEWSAKAMSAIDGDGHGRHDTTRNAVMALVGAGRIAQALALRDPFVSAVAGGRTGGTREASAEFDSFFAGAFEKIDTPLPATSTIYTPGDAVFDMGSVPESVWGDDEHSIWAVGEPLLLAADTGVGKTTVAQNVALAAIGIGTGEVLGYPVPPINGKVLYIAADRPRQAMRSLRRMVREEHRGTLHDRWVWETKRGIRINENDTEAVWRAADEVGADLVVIDSIKDLVLKTSSDESGGFYNDAVQVCVARDVQVCGLHHSRKPAGGENRKRLGLADVYGSGWLTAGAGSVVVLNGAPGTGVAAFEHLKQPAEIVGPFDVTIDYQTGHIASVGKRDIYSFVENRGNVTTAEVVGFIHGDDADENQKRVVRRKLNKMAGDGFLEKTEGVAGAPTKWRIHQGGLVQIGGEPAGHPPGHPGNANTRTPARTDPDTAPAQPPEDAGNRGNSTPDTSPGHTRTPRSGPDPDISPLSRRQGNVRPDGPATCGQLDCKRVATSGDGFCWAHQPDQELI